MTVDVAADPSRTPDVATFARVPAALVALHRWGCWRYEERDGKLTKVPMQANGRRADSTDPQTWTDYATALGAYAEHPEQFNGIGVVLGDGFCGVDLDDCFDIAGQIHPYAQRIVNEFNTYTELSPSLGGLKLFLLGDPLPPSNPKSKTNPLPEGQQRGRRKFHATATRAGDIELYSEDRFFAVTGQHYPGTPTTVRECPREFRSLYDQLFAETTRCKTPSGNSQMVPLAPRSIELGGAAPGDSAIIDKVTADPKWARLWSGDISAYGGDDSRADLSLCGRIAFFVGDDAARIDSIFRQSALTRDKWDRADYRDMTISRALDGKTEFYQWNGNGKTSSGNCANSTNQSIDRMVTPDPDVPIDTSAVPPTPKFLFHSAAEFDALDLRRDYHIQGILAAGPVPTIIAGSFKTLKTSIAVDLLVSLATGASFLNHFPVTRPIHVAIMSGESGGFALQNLVRRVARSRGWSAHAIGEHLRLCTSVMDLSLRDDLAHIERFIIDNEIKLFALDPAYLAMKGLRSDDAGSLFAMGRFLEPYARIGERTGCTMSIVHHNSRGATRANPGEPAELADIAWSGFAEWAGQWLLLSRREKFDPDSAGEHRLWLTAGGRDGHSALVGLDVVEGRHDDPDGRRWDVTALQAHSVRREAVSIEQDRREQERQARTAHRLEQDRQTILSILHDGNPETKTAIRDRSGLNTARFNPAVAALLAEHEIEPAEMTKANGQKYSGYRRTGTHPDSPGQAPGQSG